MQNSLRTLILMAILPLAGALHAQMNAHIVCEGQSLQFTPESDYWGEPIWEYSADERVWENLVLEGQDVYEIQPAITGYYRLKLYDASCDSSFYSNVQFIEVRKWTKTLQMHSTHAGYEFNPGDSLYFWVDGENLPEGVEFWVNQRQVLSTGGTDLLLPAMTQSFTIHATAGQGENCFTSDTLAYHTTSEGAKSQVPCEDPYPQVQNLSAEVSETLGGALLSWTAIQGSKGCVVRYRRVGVNYSFGDTILQNNLSSYLIPEKDLYPNTDYEWAVYCGCSVNPLIAGPWSENGTFSTGSAGTMGIYPTGTSHCLSEGDSTSVLEVYNPLTGRIWMDRNLGASQVATSLNDVAAYGDLYQWGRFGEGHQCRESSTTIVTANTVVPNAGNSWDGKFILSFVTPMNWVVPGVENLWNISTGVNNPCPEGFRVPSENEFNEEMMSWTQNGLEGAFMSPLKFTPAGLRVGDETGGPIEDLGTVGNYWSSTLSTFSTIDLSVRLYIASNTASTLGSTRRRSGLSVRCILHKIPTVQCDAVGGIMSTNDPTTNLCINEGPQEIQFEVTGNEGGGAFVIYDSEPPFSIIDYNESGFFSLNEYPPGDYLGAYISVNNNENFEGVSVISNLPICSELSNQIPFSTFISNGGILYPPLTMLNGNIVNLAVVGASGVVKRYALLNEQCTEILAINASGVFNMNTYPDGTYKAIHGAFPAGFTMADLANIDLNNLEGCIGVSNQVTIIKNSTLPIPEYPEGAVFCESGPAEVVEIMHPITGQIWMDRNLGAAQVATSPTDQAAYGDLYQWGRFSDGHQCRNSLVTTNQSATSNPGHGDYILFTSPDFQDNNWIIFSDRDLWQKGSGINNPCPSGFNLPTKAECNMEINAGSGSGAIGGFTSPLKLTAAGRRSGQSGEIYSVGEAGAYWTSQTPPPANISVAYLTSNNQLNFTGRANGMSVRCIKNVGALIETLDCSSATQTGILVSGATSEGVSFTIPYTGGNGGVFSSPSVISTGVNGLTAILEPGIAESVDSVTYNIIGIPEGSGTASFALEVGSQSCTFALEIVNCSQVENQDANIASDSFGVVLTWDAIEQTTVGCEIEYGLLDSATTIIQFGGNGLDEFTLLASGLFQNSTYRWRIRCGCNYSPDVAIAPWSDWENFSTENLGEPFGNYPEGTNHCLPGGAAVVEVLNPATGKIWMDRNLGASRVAASYTDQAAFGDLYQWGRFSDGHQCRNSPSTADLSNSDTPGHGSFIVTGWGLNGGPIDWRSPKNDNLWQSLNGINNPCPEGYRIPTLVEWEEEREIGSSFDLPGGFNSPLKLTNAGSRFFVDGEVSDGTSSYWSSTVYFGLVRGMNFSNGSSSMGYPRRSSGNPVRCIKHIPAIIDSFGCNDATINQSLVEGVPVEGGNIVIPYVGGNGGSYPYQSLSSVGVNGLTATLAAGTLVSGDGSVTYTLSGTPDGTGIAFFNMELGEQFCTAGFNVYICEQVENTSSSILLESEAVVLNWDANEQSTVNCEIEYRQVYNPIPTTVEIIGAEINSYTLQANAVFANTAYQWRVRCTCDFTQAEATSEWSEWDYFSTENIGIPLGSFSEGNVDCNPNGTEVIDVLNPITGRVWMDRNLGASQVATSLTDAAAYGDLYQWGRFSDGHQCRNSPVSATLATSPVPNAGNAWDGIFLNYEPSPGDWLQPPNANLWQDVNGINNPCPAGYRVPTQSEWTLERQSWTHNTMQGAIASPLKLPAGGRRYIGGSPSTPINVGTRGLYWSNTTVGTDAVFLDFSESGATLTDYHRRFGRSIRCIKYIPAIPAGIQNLGCTDASINGAIIEESAIEGVNATIPYTGGNGGIYPGQSVNSSGVEGLTASLPTGVLVYGNGTIGYGISGTPASTGIASFGLELGGQICTLELEVISCGSVDNLQSAFSPDSSEISLAWNPLELTTSQCQIELKTQEHLNPEFIEIIGENINTTTIPADELFQNTIYEWRVRCTCDYSTLLGLGPWSEWANFTSGNMGPPFPSYPEGSVHCIDGGAMVLPVVNPATGKTWMDRNLGASNAATAFNNASGYGDLYQWGRFSDGHQCRNSSTTNAISSSDTPEHGQFILINSSNANDWRNPQNNNLWQSVNGLNNPCPNGYRIPTDVEFNNERQSWSSTTYWGAINSILRLPSAGLRNSNSGVIFLVGSSGYYWSNTLTGASARGLFFSSSSATMTSSGRATGYSVRCIQDW